MPPGALNHYTNFLSVSIPYIIQSSLSKCCGRVTHFYFFARGTIARKHAPVARLIWVEGEVLTTSFHAFKIGDNGDHGKYNLYCLCQP